MRKALVGFFICVAIVALTRVIPRPASRAGMVFLVAADASGQVYTTYGNYSAAETCNAVLGTTPSPGRGLYLSAGHQAGGRLPASDGAGRVHPRPFLRAPRAGRVLCGLSCPDCAVR